MRMKTFLMAAATLALTGGAAQAQAQPGQYARPGQYGGGLVEYLFTARAAPAPQGRAALRDNGVLPRHPAVYGYGGPGSPRMAPTYGDPMGRYRLEPATARTVAMTDHGYSNPYEDADPIVTSPQQAPVGQPAAAAYRGVAPVARAQDPQFMRQVVPYQGHQRAGTVVINTETRHLYLVQSGNTAIRYGIGVGRPGFLWHGVKSVSAKKEWPDWTPPKEMLARRPDLPTFMAGGVENPLGARALYLGSSLYRIHGTNEPNTIGQAVSSGCIRMMNEDVIDLYDRTPVGARVEVI